MNREDCEKLLDAFENASAMSRLGTSESIMYAKDARDNLRDVILGVMTEKTGKGGALRGIDTIPYATWSDDVYRGVVPLTVETGGTNAPRIPNMNTVICDCKED